MAELQEVTAGEVRAWARGRGLPVGTRGHIHQSIVDAYNKAHRVRRYTNSNPWLVEHYTEDGQLVTA